MKAPCSSDINIAALLDEIPETLTQALAERKAELRAKLGLVKDSAAESKENKEGGDDEQKQHEHKEEKVQAFPPPPALGRAFSAPVPKSRNANGGVGSNSGVAETIRARFNFARLKRELKELEAVREEATRERKSVTAEIPKPKCGICLCEFEEKENAKEEGSVLVSLCKREKCTARFCKECLNGYLMSRVKDGMGTCPIVRVSSQTLLFLDCLCFQVGLFCLDASYRLCLFCVLLSTRLLSGSFQHHPVVTLLYFCLVDFLSS